VLASPGPLDPKVFPWKAGAEIVRCHNSEYGANEFNPKRISQRFRPFTSRRRTVPTLYGSESMKGALSETLFHAVPVDGPDRSVRLSRLIAWQGSRLAPVRDLRLIDLRDEALEDLGTNREDLIESPASSYPVTAEWADTLFHCSRQPDGLVWNSRQAKDQLALVLFERGRVSREDLDVVKVPMPLAVGRGLDLVYEVAEELEIVLVS
jgi:hypothetical protein